MSAASIKRYTEFVLPSVVMSKGDISRLVSEFEVLDAALTTKAVHKKVGASLDKIPTMSAHLSAFVDENPVSLTRAKDRGAYIKQLRLLKSNVRVMNLTFATVADPESLQQLTGWLRQSIHPQIVIDAHLQPALVAGVYVRSQNQVFDFSVRHALHAKRDELKKELGALRG